MLRRVVVSRAREWKVVVMFLFVSKANADCCIIAQGNFYSVFESNNGTEGHKHEQDRQ